MNSTIDQIAKHRSIRKFTEEPVPQEAISQAVEAAQQAATSSNVQAYSILQIRDHNVRSDLSKLCGNQEKVVACGAFFIVCADSRRHRLLAKQAEKKYESHLEGFLVGVIDASLFAQNLALAFESMNLGICYIGGLRNDLPKVGKLLRFPEGVYPLFGLCVGHPGEEPFKRPRLPAEAVLFTDQYPTDQEMLDLVARYDQQMSDYYTKRGASGRTWSPTIAAFHEAPRRESLAAFYVKQGADLS
ncbi:MAG: oxygen-insensitive NADPH nitroreductase [Phycisphaerales bacterium]|nr:oxygen-insensitive NADPH nitroreductase [Phycisphaerales bacterium]